jgi:peptidoglycan/xylan/chitin deacetylase (PgdA/CDA1 family)
VVSRRSTGADGADDADGIGARPRTLPLRSPRVLMYHFFGEPSGHGDPERLFVTAAGLHAQLDRLRRWGWQPLDLDGYLAALDGKPVPRRSFLLTIDDGHASVVDVAAPALAAAGVPSVLFVCPALLGGTSRWSCFYPTEPLAPAERLADLPGLGMELGLHGLDHTRLTDVDDAALPDHVVGARDALLVATGARARAFAYPYGTHDERACRAVAVAGYAVAFAVAREGGRYAADRIFVRGDESTLVFRWKLTAAYRLVSRAAGRIRRLRRAVRIAVWTLRGVKPTPQPPPASQPERKAE